MSESRLGLGFFLFSFGWNAANKRLLVRASAYSGVLAVFVILLASTQADPFASIILVLLPVLSPLLVLASALLARLFWWFRVQTYWTLGAISLAPIYFLATPFLSAPQPIEVGPEGELICGQMGGIEIACHDPNGALVVGTVSALAIVGLTLMFRAHDRAPQVGEK